MSDRVYSATERAAEAAGATDEGAQEEEKIPDFPVECLPPILEKQARAIAAVRRVPLGMPAPMILATASASIGRGLRVRNCIPGFITPANLFVLICKTSGSGGSVSFRDATAPFVGIQKTLRREFEEKGKPRLDAEHLDISEQINDAKQGLKKATGLDREEIVNRIAECNEKLADIEKRRSGNLLFVTDVTPEKLAEMLADNGETLAHFDSDAAAALGIILGTRYSNGKHAYDSMWLKCYTGEPFAIFRKNAEPVHLDAPCLAALFVTTPDQVQELYRTPHLTAGGLLPRFLACDPDARPMPIDVAQSDTPRTLATDAAQPYEAAIFATVNRYRLSANEEPDEIEVTPEARRICIEDWNRFCAGVKVGVDMPFEARHTENLIRIAVVLHAFRHCEIKQSGAGTYHAVMRGHEHSIDAETMGNALRVRDWFNQHEDALRAPERVAADDSAWEKAEALMRSMPAGITARDLYTGHRVCRNAATAARLLTQWLAQGRIVAFQRKPEGAGRPTTAYKLVGKARGA
jgi:hypothetical protein